MNKNGTNKTVPTATFGNYTEERRALQKNVSINEIADRIKKRKQVKQR